MNVTRQTLRDMILAEIGAVDEDAMVPRTSGRGVPGQELADMPAEEVEGILRQKAGGLSSKMAEFINAMVKAGWDRDQFIRNLAGMDDDILLTLLAPAMRESYHRAVQLLAGAIGAPCQAVNGDDGTLMTVGQFRRLVREALDYDPAYRRIAEGLPDPGSLVVTGTQLRAPMAESTLMTVGQFRRLVRETAGGGDEDRVRWKANSVAMANEIADTLISSGPLPNYGNILDALAKHVYRKQGLVDFIDFRSEMTGLQDKEIFSMWIENLDDPGDDLQMLQMALTRDVDEAGDVMSQYTAGSTGMAGAKSKASEQSGKASIAASSGRQQAQAAQDETHRIVCKSPPDVKMQRVGESSVTSDDTTDEDCVRIYEND